jgi:hypothetical protein
MDTALSKTTEMIKIAFWRMTASLIGLAIRRKRVIERWIIYVPFAIAGGIAFLLGRLIGEMLI